MTSLKLSVLKDVEIAFIREDFEVFSHLTEGIDRLLQGDLSPESYMGFLFPTLLQLQRIYEQLLNISGLKFCMPLASAILAEINIGYVLI